MVAEPARRRPQPRPRQTSEQRNAALRARLEPLAPGERPGAVTVAAIVATLLAVVNIVAALTVHVDLGKGSNNIGFTVIQSVVLLVAAGGMWKAKYWAVLGFQALLAIEILLLALALTRVEGALYAVALVVIICALGFLFWKLIRAMARIQMPEFPTRS